CLAPAHAGGARRAAAPASRLRACRAEDRARFWVRLPGVRGSSCSRWPAPRSRRSRRGAPTPGRLRRIGAPRGPRHPGRCPLRPFVLLGERGVVRHGVVHLQAGEPAHPSVHGDLGAELPVREVVEAPQQQHAQEQLRVGARAASLAVTGRDRITNPGQVEHRIDLGRPVIRRDQRRQVDHLEVCRLRCVPSEHVEP
ncbi:MAG: hypothetical protein AVDCRST_MAG68-141, partial [uncultured Gemmatimonadetes bacterium]